MGYGISRAMRFGVARGVFSNEAALGSSVMVHSSSDAKEPVTHGMLSLIHISYRQIHTCVLFLLPLRGRRSKAPSRGRRIPRFPYPYRIALRNIYLCLSLIHI